jgi:hypothetical protein
MSRRFTRQGVPGMISRQPSQRIATLSETIVRIVTPMISIDREDSRAGPVGGRAGRVDTGSGGTPKGIRTPDLHLERVAS